MFDTVAEMAKRHSIRKKINTEIVETSSISAADAIIRYAQEKDVNLIVVGARERSGMSEAFTGKCCIQDHDIFSMLCTCCTINCQLSLPGIEKVV
jgi:K+-sensing histidine kinase KdpD